MNVLAAVLIGLGIVALAWLLRTKGGPSGTFSGMWRYRGPGWPRGVQEDDDAHWSWTKAPPGEADAVPAGRPDPGDEGLSVGVTPVSYEVRSADRARS